jgi:FkbM family methyltransferase
MHEFDLELQEAQQLAARPLVSKASVSEQVATNRRDEKDRFVSYSLNFEDVILHRLFSGSQTGFYVDVGAGHPRFENDTFALYQRGWCGINIEPNYDFHAALTKDRPRDTNLRVVLSDRVGGELTYYELNGSGLSTCDPDQARIYQASGRAVVIRKVPATTLSAVLAQAGIAHINLLKVDVEGFEERVLNGNDWERFRPDVVVVEATYPESPVRRPTNIRSFMERCRYRHVYFDGLNDFYLKQEFESPEGLTLPPNVFDRFVPHEILDLRIGADFLSAENRRVLDENVHLSSESRRVLDENVRLSSENRRLLNDNAHLSRDNRRLRSSAEQMREELLTLNRLLERLHAVSESLERRDTELREARAHLQNIYTSNSWFLTKPWRFVGRQVKGLVSRAGHHLKPWSRA